MLKIVASCCHISIYMSILFWVACFILLAFLEQLLSWYGTVLTLFFNKIESQASDSLPPCILLQMNSSMAVLMHGLSLPSQKGEIV